MYCEICGEENELDARYCKKCGHLLAEDFEEEPTQRSQTGKAKTKTKKKTKKSKKTKVKHRKAKTKDNREKGKMNFFQKFVLFFLMVFVVGLLGVVAVLGYHIYQEETIVIPDVVGLSYADAELILAKADLKATKVEKTTTDQDEVGIILSQKKKAGAKARKNQTIQLQVGVLDTSYVLPNLIGKSLEEAKAILEEHQVTYTVTSEISSKPMKTVIKQSPKANTRLKTGVIVELVIAQKALEEPVSTPTPTPHITPSPEPTPTIDAEAE